MKNQTMNLETLIANTLDNNTKLLNNILANNLDMIEILLNHTNTNINDISVDIKSKIEESIKPVEHQISENFVQTVQPAALAPDGASGVADVEQQTDPVQHISTLSDDNVEKTYIEEKIEEIDFVISLLDNQVKHLDIIQNVNIAESTLKDLIDSINGNTDLMLKYKSNVKTYSLLISNAKTNLSDIKVSDNPPSFSDGTMVLDSVYARLTNYSNCDIITIKPQRS